MTESSAKNIDFPTWLPPSVVKELRQGLRTSAFTVTLTLTPIALSLLFVLGFITDSDSNRLMETTVINSIFWVILTLGMLLIMPLRAISCIREEITAKTVDMLVLTNLTPWRIVWGKWCSYMIQTVLIVLTVLPFFFVKYYYGGVNLMEEIIWFSYLLIGSATVTALAIWISGMPAILRYPFIIILVLFGFQTFGSAISMIMLRGFMGASTSLDNHQLLLALALTLFHSIIMIAAFLLLASRWVAPASDNSSGSLRLLTFLPLLPIPFYPLFLDMEAAGVGMLSQVIAALAFASFICVLELTSPLTVQPVHFAKVEHTRFAWFKKVFLLPGFFSASMFLTLFTAIMIVLVLVVAAVFFCCTDYMTMPDMDKAPELLLATVWFCLLWWFSVHAPAYLLSFFARKLGYATAIIYAVLIIPYSIATAVLQLMGAGSLATLVPWGCLWLPFYYLMGEGGSSGVFSVFLTVLSAIIGIVVISTASAPWREARKKAKELSYLNQRD